jgi:hypothetical protein
MQPSFINIKRTLFLALISIVPSISSGQVLEVVPDDMKPVVERVAHTGSCYTGSSGLVTIPTPDFHDTKVAVSYKSGTWDQDINVNGTLHEVEKDEFTASMRFNLSPHVELSANHLKYERKSTPTATGLDTKEDTVAFGMKYSAHQGDKDICLGFTFAPMSAEELNMADIEQIENLRNVYLTVTEKITDDFDGYLNLTSAFTKKQEIDFGNGVVQKVNRKDILIGGFGLEYRLADVASVFCEYKVGNYRDIFSKDSVRHRFHGGFRVGTSNIQAEILGMNLSEDNPTLVMGGSLAF